MNKFLSIILFALIFSSVACSSPMSREPKPEPMPLGEIPGGSDPSANPPIMEIPETDLPPVSGFPMGGLPDSELPVACTMDAKICPDGSAVGRTAPDCEFAPCPGE